MGQDAVHCRCGRTMLDITHGKIRGGGAVVDVHTEQHIRPIAEAPHDKRTVSIFWHGDEYRVRWDEDARGWRELGGNRFWLGNELLGWAPWSS